MDVRELRIGNLIVANGLYEGKQMTVGGISGQGTMSPDKRVIMFQDYAVGEFVKDCSGIPLTSELLLRFGFKVHNEDRTSIEYWIGHNPVTRDYLFMVCEIKGGPEVEIFYRNGFHRLRFVHQLMNLYYALTGTELTLK